MHAFEVTAKVHVVCCEAQNSNPALAKLTIVAEGLAFSLSSRTKNWSKLWLPVHGVCGHTYTKYALHNIRVRTTARPKIHPGASSEMSSLYYTALSVLPRTGQNKNMPAPDILLFGVYIPGTRYTASCNPPPRPAPNTTQRSHKRLSSL